MYQLLNITSDPHQQLQVVLPDGTNVAQLNLDYSDNSLSWYMSLSYGTFTLNNRRICTSPNLLKQWDKILPFGLACFTIDGSDPFYVDDFLNARCGLVVLTEVETERFENMLSVLKGELA